jgi:undecaprenyl-diphosphatase
MDLFKAIILGIVEGISEFLPISSTGHMILASNLMGLRHTDFLKSFEIAIQVGAILSVIFLYRRMLLMDFHVIKLVVVAFIPTGFLGLTLYKLVKDYLLGSASIVLWSLLIGGIFLVVFEKWHGERENAETEIRNISYKEALIIGLFQSVAMIPGVSRSASTIVGGLILGLKRKVIVEFSFLLAVPTMLAATIYDLIKTGSQISLMQTHYLLVGFITSFVVALFSIKFLLRFIQTHTFIPFGIYRIVLVVFWFVLLIGF